ncbi:MAG TPA: filamentous hemagglutinin N-terminal domain-containing protein [Verrucomicrobiae bacterium]|nr:filamentous hemagglutinin N-terminal domain-containing protein [Verrucomicrobiae bacterium]
MKGHRFCVRIALATAVLASANFARGNPKGGTVSQGSATFNTSGSQFTVSTSDRAFINWQSFNIGVGETTTFVQPSSSSLVWNQINDPNPSQILGTLNANGYVVLQNSAGFYVGGQASITTHGLMLTTAPIPNLDLSSSDPWQFSAPPPSASIINYGQINVGQGGSAFIIANNVQNQGTISAPGGTIGLYAGKDVLVSSRPDGRGLSATVTLPSGSVDNEGKLIADGGTIALHAQVVNQGGLIQANSVANVNGTIELVAGNDSSDNIDASLTLGANSLISARSDGSSGSSGGTVTIASDKNFSDQNTAAINVSGAAQAGLPFTFTVNGNSALGSASGATDGGKLSISAANIGTIQSVVDGHAVTGPTGGKYTIDAANLTLNNAFINSIAPTFDAGQYKITLQADKNITFLNNLVLLDPGASALLSLTAGNDIILNQNSSIQAGNNWNLSLSAGPLNLAAKPTTARTDGIYLDNNSFIQTQNGNIDLWAANEVILTGTLGAIRTMGGGSIDVTTKFGNVNSGGNQNGFVFNSPRLAPPLYTVSPNLGGISTAAGGDVNINAGGDVISYLPTQADVNSGKFEGGSGAFGSNPGNVTITAGGNVTGHYVVANGIGSITAKGGDVGVPQKQTGGFALSLIKGSWNVDAPHGSIYLKEVRNPNGVFNSQGSASSPGFHFFDYDPEDSVSLHAANSVEITGGNPRLSSANVPMLFPSSLSVLADTGSFVLDDNVILFPSPDQNLNITTLAGNFEGNNKFLEMSDSARRQWTGLVSGEFLKDDHAPTPPELDNPNAVEISIAGSMDNLTLYTTKETHIFVGGDINNSGFLGENLHSSDKTTINVLGRIFNTPVLNFVNLPGPIVGSDSSDPTRWDAFFELAVDPSVLDFDITGLTPDIIKADLIAKYLLFPNANSRFGLGANPGFIYDPTTDRLGFNGSMAGLSATQISALKSGVFTLLVIDKNGNPVIDPSDPNHLLTQTTPYTFLSPTDPSNSGKDSASLIASLYSESLAAPSKPASGFQIGGPGEFKITAGSIELGNSSGILSWGIGSGGQLQGVNYSSLAGVTPDASGATINVITTGDLTMQTSRIASMFGGDVNITSTDGSINVGAQNFFITSVSPLAYGIYSSGHGDVTVTAQGDININGSRIAAYDGGDVTIESYYGNVNAGSGGNTYVNVPIVRSPGKTISDPIYGSGILAESLPVSLQSPGATKPGDITVTTPRGDIIAGQAGILQLALDGNIAGGPKVTLHAGTAAVKDDQGNIITPAITGNIDLGQSGLIGGEVDVTAQGDIKGLIVSRQGSTVNAAQNFSGTVLSAGNANVSAGGTVAGVIVGIGGANVSGTITADVLGQNVSVNGGASTSTLGTTATATAASQSAANEATSETEKQVASDDSKDDDKKKKGKAPVLARRTGRVTVLMPKAI